MPVVELRKIMQDAVTPFLKGNKLVWSDYIWNCAGGWEAGEKDEQLYTIHLMDKSGHELVMDIPLKVGLTLVGFD